MADLDRDGRFRLIAVHDGPPGRRVVTAFDTSTGRERVLVELRDQDRADDNHDAIAAGRRLSGHEQATLLSVVDVDGSNWLVLRIPRDPATVAPPARRWLVPVAAGIVAAAAVAAWWLLLAPLPPVVAAVVGPPGDDTASLAVHAAATNALARLRHVYVLEPRLLSGSTPDEIARATGAEVLTLGLETDRQHQVTIRRLSSGGAFARSFLVPCGTAGDRQLLAEVTATNVQGAFGWRRRIGRKPLQLSPGAWDEYLALVRTELHPSGDIFWERFLERLSSYRRRNPDHIAAAAAVL